MKRMIYRGAGGLLAALVISLGAALLPFNVPAAETDSDSALEKLAPRTVRDLEQIQAATGQHIEDLISCTVGLKVGQAHASGVIVTADGYVMTAAHVVGEPGKKAEILFSNGRTAKGQTLGFNADIDGGLIKITDEGPWPFAPIVPAEKGPKLGDWCLALGHPGGFLESRTPPVRLGRVILATSYVIHTDCAISEGDSGGPLFDLHGRVIGVHSRIAEEVTVNLHVPAVAVQSIWERLKRGEVYPQSRFLDSFDTNKDGQISVGEIPEGTYRQVFQRLARQFGFDPSKAHSIEELRSSIGWYERPRTQFEMRRAFRPFRLADPSEEQFLPLSKDRFVRGRTVLSAFRGVMTDIYKSTVEVRGNGKKVALGTIIDPDGWVITKASQLDGTLTCKLYDGRSIPSRLIETDTQNDIALLRIRAGRLDAVELGSSAEADLGDWVITSAARRDPVSVGVLSIASREIPRSPAVLGVQIDAQQPRHGALITAVVPDSGASEAGIQPNDLITEIKGVPVADFNQLQTELKKCRVGESVKVTILRGENVLVLSVMLSERHAVFQSDQASVHGRRSTRRDDFPAAIQHDSVLDPTDCGGPLVDIHGNILGINIARGERTASYAIPTATVAEVVRRLMVSGKGRQ